MHVKLKLYNVFDMNQNLFCHRNTIFDMFYDCSFVVKVLDAFYTRKRAATQSYLINSHINPWQKTVRWTVPNRLCHYGFNNVCRNTEFIHLPTTESWVHLLPPICTVSLFYLLIYLLFAVIQYWFLKGHTRIQIEDLYQ